jgi:hypothetical protein
MNHIIGKVNRNPVIFSIFTALIFFGFYVVLRDPVLSKDSYTYSRWADILLKHSFNYKEYFNEVNFYTPPFLYSGFVSVVAITKKILGDNWQQGIVIINTISFIAISGLISHLLYSTTNNSKAAIFSSVLFILCVECFIWIRYVLSDSTFLFLTFFSTFLFLSLSENKNSKKHWFAVILAVFFMATYRPTALPLIVVIVLSYPLFQLNISSQYLRSIIAKNSLFFFIIIILLSILMMAYIMQDVRRWPLDFASDYLSMIADSYKQGNIIDDRPETFVAAPEAFFDYVKIIFIRFYYFFVFSIDAYSFRHSLLNYIVFIPSYLLGILGSYQILSSKSSINKQTWKLGMISLLIVCSTFVFVSFLLIDYDWRYRLVIMPYIFILAGIGFNKVNSDD